jgi:DNA-binding CsgD family transcriptional regulator
LVGVFFSPLLSEMRLKINNFWFYIFLLTSYLVTGQHVPVITNYNASSFKAHHQNWAITQGNDKMMYFGNTNGLLTFDANSWQLYRLNSKKIARSVLYHNERIYTGAYGELGYWTSDECKKLSYHDLKGLLPAGIIDNEELWHITSFGEIVYFQSFSVLLGYDGEKFHKIELPGSVMFLHVVGKMKYIQVLGQGIFYIDNQHKAQKLQGSEYFADKTVTGIIAGQGNQSLLITTNSDGIFIYTNGIISPWNVSYNRYFSEVQINKTILLSNGDIVIGTIRDGLLIFERSGRLKFHISTSNGLQNNSILALKEDRDHNLWVGMDKGISIINLSDDILQFRDVNGLIGSVYTAAMRDSILYLGTNQGVYFTDLRMDENLLTKPDFKLVKGTQGQAWHLFTVQDHVFCGHNDGSFIIKGDKAIKISDITGGWYNELFNVDGKNFILQGNYTGLYVFNVEKNNITFSHKVNGYNRPVKKFFISGSYIWVTGPNNGLSKLSIDQGFKNVTFIKKYALPYATENQDNLDIVFFRNMLTVSDGAAHYYLDESKDNLVPYGVINQKSGGYIIRTSTFDYWLKIFSNNAVKMKGNQEVGLLPFTFNQDYHNIANLKNGWNLYCLDDGYLLDKMVTSGNLVKSDSTIYCNIHFNGKVCYPAKTENTYKIPFGAQNLRFQIYDFNFDSGKKYEYKLLSNQNDWKEIENNGSIQFANLNHGKYILEVRRNDGKKTTVNFEILPPWYLGLIAKFIYILIGIVMLYMVNKYYEKKLKTEKFRHMKENERLVREHRIQMDNQRLVSENQIKNKELANATLQLVQKNEILQEIKDELIEIRKTGDHTLTTKDFQIFMKQINENLTTKSDKKLFDISFNEVHDAFLTKLKKEYPDLSADDLKLASYLRMNLASKDIAPLFNISIRGLENKRYRLRKKLNLPNDTNLTDFFINFSL